jgi:hypothetical protein
VLGLVDNVDELADARREAAIDVNELFPELKQEVAQGAYEDHSRRGQVGHAADWCTARTIGEKARSRDRVRGERNARV